MLEQVLLGVGIILDIILYLMFFITYINNNNQKYSKTAQETVIDLLKENPNINVIKNNSQFFSKYNIKRKIVKLSNNTYERVKSNIINASNCHNFKHFSK